jgi:hypothetical protein
VAYWMEHKEHDEPRRTSIPSTACIGMLLR